MRKLARHKFGVECENFQLQSSSSSQQFGLRAVVRLWNPDFTADISLSGMLNADHLRQWFRGKIYALRSPYEQSLALSCVRAGDGIQLPRMSLPTICSYVVWLHRKSFFSPRFTLPRGHLDLSAYVCQSF